MENMTKEQEIEYIHIMIQESIKASANAADFGDLVAVEGVRRQMELLYNRLAVLEAQED